MKCNLILVLAILALDLFWLLYLLFTLSWPEFYGPFACFLLFGIGIVAPMLTKRCRPWFTTVCLAVSLLLWIGLTVYIFVQ